MDKFIVMLTGLLVLGLFIGNEPMAQPRERSEVQVQYTWNLKDLYQSDEAWNEAKESVVSQFDKILQYKGKLTSDPSVLLACLDFDSHISKELTKLYSYASMCSDENTKDLEALGMEQEMSQHFTNYGSLTSYIEPELLKMDLATLEKFLDEEPKLEPYRFDLYDLQRRKEYTLSEKEEKILAEAGLMADGPYSIYNIFSNGEVPFPKVTFSDGSEVLINQAGYVRNRAHPNRDDRENVFKEFWNTYKKFKGTFGAQLYAGVKTDVFYARTRGYESSLHRSLDRNNIPVEVYHTLINNVHKHLDTFHRYLNLRKKMMDLDTLKYSDLYAPLVKGVELEYSIDEAQNLIKYAMEPLGKQYTDVLKEAYDNRWIDYYATPGKRSGAYSNGSAYDIHPYILMNYDGLYNGLRTLAHELGHTMHSYFSNKTQPYPTAGYSIFVAEVASTFNEALLKEKLLKSTKDDEVRLSLLGEYLENIRQTVFRQTQFAEFELKIHEKAEKNEPLTGDVLTEMYADILNTYYGHEKGVCHIDDLYHVEWAYIPHFYYNFYVYQYATSLTASTALAEKVLNKEKGMIKKYINFLSAGGSDYPINILKKAGVDMTTSEPFEKTMDAMNRTMDEIEKIIEKKEK